MKTLVLLLAMGMAVGMLQAAPPAKGTAPAAAPSTTPNPTAPAVSSGFASKFQPDVGASYMPLIPIGDIGTINFGLVGVYLNGSVAIPEMSFLPLAKYHMRLRGGLSAGFHSFSQDIAQSGVSDAATGKITLIPIMTQIFAYWDVQAPKLSFQISPYFRLGNGVIFSSVETAVNSKYISQIKAGSETTRSGSYIGYALNPALGVEFKVKSMPQIGYFMDFGYLMHFQDTSGSYITMNFGAAYRFGVK
jgi:hypothetical protein